MIDAAPGQVLVERFCCSGTPVYSDMTDGTEGPWFGLYGDAQEYGRAIVAIGNWSSFGVEKRFFSPASAPEAQERPVPPQPSAALTSDSAAAAVEQSSTDAGSPRP